MDSLGRADDTDRRIGAGDRRFSLHFSRRPPLSARSSRRDQGRRRAMNARLLDTEAEVETPEQIRFSYRVAGPAHRLIAYGLDLVLRGVILFFVVMIFGLSGVAAGEKLAEATLGIILIVVFVLEWGYFVLFETLLDGQSPGKRALGLRVVN